MRYILFVSVLLAGFVTLQAVNSVPSAMAGEKNSVFTQVVQNGKLRCGYSVWPPYFMKDPNTGQLSGINYDQAEAIARQLDLKIDWVSEIGFGEVVSALNSGKIDMMCASLWPDPARMKLLTLTRPLFFTPAYVYARADDNRFAQGAATLNKKEIQFVGIEGDVTYTAAKTVFPSAKLLALPQNSDPSQLLLSLTGSKADAVILDEAFAQDYIKTNPGKIKQLNNIGAVQVYSESFGLKQGEVEFKNALDMAIESMINGGVSKSILARYRNSSYAPKATF